MTTLDNFGIVCNFEKLKPNDIGKRLGGIIKAYGVNISPQDLQLFIEVCGTNMQILINEMRKLIEYVGNGGTITKKEIELLCIKQLDYIIFDLTDNLGKKDTKKALEVLHELIYNKEPIQKILITIYNHFKKLYIVNVCERLRLDTAKNLNLKPNQTFLINKYRKQSQYFKEKELRNVLKELINLDEKYKKGSIDITVGLESILCTYCS